MKESKNNHNRRSKMENETKVRKPRAAVKKDKFFLAIRQISDKLGQEGDAEYLPIAGTINFGNQRDVTITDYTSKQAAFKASKKMPDFIEANDVRIISVSDRITVTKKTQLKFSL